MDLFNTLGYMGGFLLAFCSVPEAFLAFKRKDSGLSWPFLMMWLWGEIFIIIPIIFDIKVGFLLLNYTLNIVLILIICYYKVQGIKNRKLENNLKN